MTLLARLQRRFGKLAIPNLTATIIAGQVVLYFANEFRAAGGKPPVDAFIRLNIPKVLNGEAWRLISFAFAPPHTQVIFFAFIGWMMFYLFGSTLERIWGAFRYNVFLGVALAANIAAAFIAWRVWGMPEPMLPPEAGIGEAGTAANVLLYGTVFLAFARMCPDMIINLFFVLPIKIKWLALVAWIGYGYSLIRYDGPARLFVLASLANYALFFGREHWRELMQRQRRRSFQSKAKEATATAGHTCRVCGASNADSHKTLFRYCSKCAGQCCYCPDHIRNHEHVTIEEPVTP